MCAIRLRPWKYEHANVQGRKRVSSPEVKCCSEVNHFSNTFRRVVNFDVLQVEVGISSHCKMSKKGVSDYAAKRVVMNSYIIF